MTTTRTKDQITADIIAFFQDNTDVFNECIEDLDSYNGYLNDDRYYSMTELDEFYQGTAPTDILYRAFYGYDEFTYRRLDNGDTLREPFNPNRDYFRYNGYGNLVSTDCKDYSDKLDRYAIEEMFKYRNHIDQIDDTPELQQLFDELETIE